MNYVQRLRSVARRSPCIAQAGSPLRSWRNAEATSEHDLIQLRASLQRIAILGEPRWPAAASGDAIEAIELVMRAIMNNPPALLIMELACSAVFLCAMDGSASGANALDNLRRFFASVEKERRPSLRRRRSHPSPSVSGGHDD